jgi:hypothetical protein
MAKGETPHRSQVEFMALASPRAAVKENPGHPHVEPASKPF